MVHMCKLGFKYISENPDAYGDIAGIKGMFDEYDKLQRELSNQPRAEESLKPKSADRIAKQMVDLPLPSSDSYDSCCDEAVKQIQALSEKMQYAKFADEIEICATSIAAEQIDEDPPHSDSDVLVRFNRHMEEKLENMKAKRAMRQPNLNPRNEEFVIKTPKKQIVDVLPDSDVLVRYIQYLEEKLEDMKANRAKRQPNLMLPNETFVVNKSKNQVQPITFSDSDNISSEVLISRKEFAKPPDHGRRAEMVKAVRAELVKEKTRAEKESDVVRKKRNIPRVSAIEQHIVISIEYDENPKIATRYYFEKSTQDGSMQLKFNLGFNDGVFYQGQQIEGIDMNIIMPFGNALKF